MKQDVIAIFDIGKTNKKVFLFNKEYRVVYEHAERLEETVDEDGDACENINLLRSFVLNTLKRLQSMEPFRICAINFSTYGASFVWVDEQGICLGPLYNYLKPFPPNMQESLYEQYGGIEKVSLETASPVLGSLNSGMQLFRMSKEQPSLFEKAKFALHLPQYISSLLTKSFYSDITSIGCHTALWNFSNMQYHPWVEQEGIASKLAPILSSSHAVQVENIPVGIGLHDSSAALIPYLLQFKEPFVLISTGTWSISLNPFNDHPLTIEELQQDCLCYLSFEGKPVKASRLFLGPEYEKGVDISTLVKKQIQSTQLVLKGTNIKKIFVDGGFSKNMLFMQLLKLYMPGFEICSASIAQASALGAALAIHHHWNETAIPNHMIELKYF